MSAAGGRAPGRANWRGGLVAGGIALVVFGLLCLLGLAGVLTEDTARLPSLVAAVALLVGLLWAGRWRWIFSVLLWVPSAFCLFVAPPAAGAGEPGWAVGLLVTGTVLYAGSIALECFLGDRFGAGNWDAIWLG